MNVHLLTVPQRSPCGMWGIIDTPKPMGCTQPSIRLVLPVVLASTIISKYNVFWKKEWPH